MPEPVRSALDDFSLLDEIQRHVGPAERGHRLSELTFVVFDLRFLAPEARRLCLPSMTSRPILDSRLRSQSLQGPAEEHTREAAALGRGVPVVGRHSGLGDAMTSAEVFVRILAILERRGVRTLGDALEAARRARTPTI